jgi:nucleoside-diphosphate-sugar epimerase
MTDSQQLILTTGGTGYIGAHTVDSFLRHGYRVRLVGRNNSSCEKMLATHDAFRDQIETAIVPDITRPGAFDTAVQGVDGVIHLASPFFHGFKDVEKEMLLPAINGTTEVLKSVAKHAPQVKRVVITSSVAAMLDLSKGLWPGKVYTEDDWNPATYEMAKEKHAVAYS